MQLNTVATMHMIDRNYFIEFPWCTHAVLCCSNTVYIALLYGGVIYVEPFFRFLKTGRSGIFLWVQLKNPQIRTYIFWKFANTVPSHSPKRRFEEHFFLVGPENGQICVYTGQRKNHIYFSFSSFLAFIQTKEQILL